MKLQILKYPHQLLSTKAAPVTDFKDKFLKELVDNMLETMYDSGGIGLAAPQVGVSKKVVVIDISQDKSEPMIFVNPEIAYKSQAQISIEERCLSLPNFSLEVPRSQDCFVRYRTVSGDFDTKFTSGLLSICLQHEIDHLFGITLADKGHGWLKS